MISLIPASPSLISIKISLERSITFFPSVNEIFFVKKYKVGKKINDKINKKKNFIYLNDLKLIFYHFSGVKKIFNNFYSLGLRMFVDDKYDIKKDIYMKYIKKLISINKKINLNQSKKYLLHTKGSKIKALLSILYNRDYLYLTS